MNYAGNELEFSFDPTIIVTKCDVEVTYRGKTAKMAVLTDNPVTYNITWNLYDGTSTTIVGKWDGEEGATAYVCGIEYTLPTNIIGPTGKIFDYWIIDGAIVTNINVAETGDKTIKAVYRLVNSNPNQRPSSAPYYPSGGGGGGLSVEKNDNIVVVSEVFEKDYKWVSNQNELGVVTYRAMVSKESSLAKALEGDSKFKSYYSVQGNDYIVIKNGIYNLQSAGNSYYYLFDSNGNMTTGFMSTDENTIQYLVDETNAKMVAAKKNGKGKYFFLDESNDKLHYGMMWNQSVIRDGILYTFDEAGRVLSETAAMLLSNEGFEYDPIIDKWKYFTIDSNGNREYVKNMVKKTSDNEIDNWYMFDENGYMKTGLTEYNGERYYLQ